MGAYRFSSLFVMRHPDEDLRRRGQNLIIILWGLIGLTMLSLPSTILNNQIGSVINALLVLPLGIGLILLTHRGHVSAVALTMTIANLASLMLVPLFGSAPFSIISYYFVINIMVAGVVMRPRAIWATLALNLVALALTTWLVRETPQEPPNVFVVGLNVALMQGFATLIAILSAATSVRALREAQRARAEAERANRSLAENNASLERQVAERTLALSGALVDRESQARALQLALAEQERMNDLITELSLPVIPINSDTLVVPLVGGFDSTRASLLLERVLAHVEGRRAKMVILDVTGLPIVDSHVARALLATAEAARLLGARAILVGIRPEVAQSLVSLGVELPNLQTYATLEQALGRLFVLKQGTTLWAWAR